VGNSFAGHVLRQSDLSKAASADFSRGTVAAPTNLATISPVATNVLPSVPATSITSTPDKSNLARLSNTNETGQAVSQPGSQNDGSLQFGAAPPSLQLHSTSFTIGQPGPPVSLNASQMIDQVAYAVQYSHANGQQMQLHLNPPELGALSVDVSMHDGVLSARIEAQTPNARQILVDNISQLKDSLTQQGVSFDRIDVQLAGSNWGSGGSSTADKSFAQQQDGALPWDQQLVPPESDESAIRKPAMTARDPRLALTTLDIMI
jgi:flagellar hook-length control protein FliK